MRKEDQLRALAKLDGYVDIEVEHKRASVFSPCGWMIGRIEASCCDDKLDVPDYLFSRDAIVSLIEKLPSRIQLRIVTRYLSLVRVRYDDRVELMTAKPTKLCEATLIETETWKD